MKRAAEEPLRPHHHLGRSTPNPNTHTAPTSHAPSPQPPSWPQACPPCPLTAHVAKAALAHLRATGHHLTACPPYGLPFSTVPSSLLESLFQAGGRMLAHLVGGPVSLLPPSLPPVFSYSTHVLFLCSLSPCPQPLFLCIMKSYSAPYIQATDPLGSCFVLFLKASSVLYQLRVSNLSCCCNFFPACHVLSFPWTESLQAWSQDTSILCSVDDDGWMDGLAN